MKNEIIALVNHKRAKAQLLLDAVDLMTDTDLTTKTTYALIFTALRAITSSDNYQEQIDPVIAAGEITLMNNFIADIVKLKS